MTEFEEVELGPCGDSLTITTYYWEANGGVEGFKDRRRFAHQSKCKACAVLEGRSKARVMTQNAVAALFAKGIDGRRTHTGNLSSKNGVLRHYWTTEAIRTPDGTVIGNTQCWSGGFAYCPRLKTDYRLPLTEIEENYSSWNRGEGVLDRGIQVLDTEDGLTLFRLGEQKYQTGDIKSGAHFLHGWDEGEFLTELPVPVRTVTEALESLRPEAVQFAEKSGVKVKRQGDLFFYPAGEERPFPEELDPNSEGYSWSHFELVTENIWGGAKTMKRLIRPSVLDTTHTAGELCVTPRGTFVRGQIRHGSLREFNRQHRTLDLGDEWHFAVQNRALRSWNVERRGGGGFD